MSILDDIKKGFKGSKEYQEGKKKRKVARAKKKEGKTWTKAVKKQKKKGEAGVSLSSLISKRKGLKKGTAEYAKVQNAINKAYGVKKRHKATVESGKPAASKPKAPKKIDKPKKEKEAKDIARHQKRLDAHRKHLDKVGVVSPPSIKKVTKEGSPIYSKADYEAQTEEEKSKWKNMAEGGKVESYSKGGKVESNPYGWPSSDEGMDIPTTNAMERSQTSPDTEEYK